ncbi:YciI family protein [Fulvivirgaceae bacterium BMA12]|uniref:YciI family protein n=1 Tax=Agaribacillus aureus TaxID=3051825 RepID=A0ABT8LFW2_9BACT|nr:YciI family protein [Fulvivirgaceae bacterium BMA12]
MAKYLYLFRGGDENWANASPEETQAHMQKWGVWMQDLAQKGKLVDGLPLAKPGKVVEKSGEVIHDGPFAEGAEVVGGYLIINADSLDEAVQMSKECPIYEHNGSTEVREIMNMDM